MLARSVRLSVSLSRAGGRAASTLACPSGRGIGRAREAAVSQHSSGDGVTFSGFPRRWLQIEFGRFRSFLQGDPVLGSVGPTMARTADEWREAYREQAEALAAAGVEGFLIETILTLEEGVAAIRAAAATGVGPVWASFTPTACGNLPDGSAPE